MANFPPAFLKIDNTLSDELIQYHFRYGLLSSYEDVGLRSCGGLCLSSMFVFLDDKDERRSPHYERSRKKRKSSV